VLFFGRLKDIVATPRIPSSLHGSPIEAFLPTMARISELERYRARWLISAIGICCMEYATPFRR